MSRNFYILFILLVCMQLVAKGQSTVTIFADSAVGKSRSIRAYAASNMSFQDDSILLKDERGSTAATNNFEHGYCVFNLAAAGIPAGSTISSVSLGYYVSSIAGTGVAYGNYYVNGIVGDLSTNSDTLNMISILKHDKLSNDNALYVSSGTVGFGTSAGYYTVNLNRNLSWLSSHADGSISLVWAQRSTVDYFTRRYAIAGYTGVASTSTPNHRPYLTITYIAPGTCSGAPVGGNTVAMPSAGDATTYHSLSLSGGTEASGLSYQWQRSTTATGTYNAISGATNRTYSFSGVSATYYYRCAISCGGSTNYSQPCPIFLIGTNTCRNPIYVQRNLANYVTSFDNPMGQNAFNVTLWGDSSTYLVDSTVSTPMAYNNMINAPSMQGLIFNKGYDHFIQVRSGYVGHNWTAWMDYNNNGTFETSENIGGMQDSVSEGVTNGSLAIVPLTLPDGYYRLRVVSDYMVLSPIACPTVYVRGMVRDYLVRVVESVPAIRSTWSSANLGLVSRGMPSNAQSILVKGRALATDTGRLTMSVNVPFQISADRATWSTSYTAPYASRTYTDTVFVRCNPTVTGVFTDTLRVSGGGYSSTLKITLRAESRDSCSGVPIAGVTQSSHDTANIFTTFVLSLNGSSSVTRLNYQWESSVTGASGIWTSITGATNSSYEHHELTRTTFFRCKVRCVSGSFVDSSTPVRVIWASGGARCIIADSV